MLIAARHRVRPSPNLKPTTLAQVGGTWPPASMQLSLAEAPTVGNSTALKYEIATQVASGQWSDESGLTTTDDMGALIALTDAEQLNALSLAQATSGNGIIGEGDADNEAVPTTLAWSIQTGAYRDRSYAEFQHLDARNVIEEVVPSPHGEIVTTVRDGEPLYRVRFHRMTEAQADSACAALIQHGGECFSMRDRSISDD